MSAVTGWRAELAAARLPVAAAVAAWDLHWRRWWLRAIANGKTPNAAVAIAWRLTEDQYGQRPEINNEERP